MDEHDSDDSVAALSAGGLAGGTESQLSGGDSGVVAVVDTVKNLVGAGVDALKAKMGLGLADTGVTGSAEAANSQIQAFLSSGLLSFDAQAFRVTKEEELLMGIFDPSTTMAEWPTPTPTHLHPHPRAWLYQLPARVK